MWGVGRMFTRTLAAQIRQHTEPRIFFLETCGVVYSLIAGAFGPKLELLSSVSDLPILLIPVAAVMSVLLLRNGYRRSGDSNAAASFTDVILAGAAAVLSQLALSLLKPEWVMPRWAPTQGGLVGGAFVTVVRTLFPSGPKHGLRTSEARPFRQTRFSGGPLNWEGRLGKGRSWRQSSD